MNATDMRDYYSLLGVQASAGTSDIHKAYWRKASIYHPDKGGTHEKMVQITEAWRILSDPSKRARYDQMREYHHDGWHSKKFDEDVLDARKKAETYAPSWAEFEEVYQKAFYTFNQDFYGENLDFEPSGPFSPFMNSKNNKARAEGGPREEMKGVTSKTRYKTMLNYLFKTIIIVMAVVFAFIWHWNNSGIGRYVPLSHKDQGMLILDTTNGAVYSAEKLTGAPSTWKEIIQPFPYGL